MTTTPDCVRPLRGPFLALCAVATALACTAPPVAPLQDQFTCGDAGICPSTGVIRGTAIFAPVIAPPATDVCKQIPQRGDVVLLLFASNQLPPPDGTALAPASIARIPQATMFAASTGAAFSAPFLFTEVKPGSYQIRAFIDVSGEFEPFSDYSLSPRACSPIGGSVNYNAQGVATLANFDVPSNQVVQVNVVLGTEAPYDPPAFKIASGATGIKADFDRPQLLQLKSFNPNVAHGHMPNAHFGIELKRDAHGAPAYSNGDGLIDVYPQVFLRQLTDANNAAPATPAVIPCKVLATPWTPQLLASAPGATPIAADTINVLVLPAAATVASDGTQTLLPSVPPGNYQVVVIEKSGQFWTVPNSLASATLGISGVPVATQGDVVAIAAPSGLPGAITGKVVYPQGYVHGNLTVQVFAGKRQMAPPRSPALPLRVKSYPAIAVRPDASNTFSFRVDGLPNGGPYVVEVLDDGDGNFNGLSLFSSVTRGDVIGGPIDPVALDLAEVTVNGPTDVGTITLNPPVAPGLTTLLDPPVFALDETAGVAQMAQDARGTVRFTVRATAPTSSPPNSFPIPNGGTTSTFTVGLVTENGGAVDNDHDGLPDVWPRVALLLLDTTKDPSGLTLAQPLVAIPAAVDPTPFLPALLANPNAGLTQPATVITANSLSIIVRPTGVDPITQTPQPLTPGKYKVVLMNKSGQVWQIPNESEPLALDPASACTSSCAAGQISTASQGRFFTVTPANSTPAGEIDGSIQLPQAITRFYSATVLAFRSDSPPPPLGVGTPVSADVHFVTDLVSGTGGNTVPFALRGLAAGKSYYVTALIDLRGDFAFDPVLWALAPGPTSLAGSVVDSNFAPTTVALTQATPKVTGVSVPISPQALPARPSFWVTKNGNPVTGEFTPVTGRFTLSPVTLLTKAVAPFMPETAGASPFPVFYKGCNGDGSAVQVPGFNFPDLYPHVMVVKLADSDPTGVTIDPNTTLIPAAIDPTNLVSQLGACSPTAVTGAGSVDVLIANFAVQPQPDGSVARVSTPSGRYGIVLISRTGQVWRVPNELGPNALDPRSLATSSGANFTSQGALIRIP